MRTVAFLDANVLAKPFTRTILLVGTGVASSTYRVVWSPHVEADAQRALDRRFGGRAEPLASIRQEHGFELVPPGSQPGRFAGTRASDRQVLADAARAGAGLLVTEDVDDFGEADLTAVGMCAMHHDLFAADFLTVEGYLAALSPIARDHPISAVHAAVGKMHPRLFARFADQFPGIDPLPGSGKPPHVERRGTTPPATISHPGG